MYFDDNLSRPWTSPYATRLQRLSNLRADEERGQAERSECSGTSPIDEADSETDDTP